MLHRYHTAMSLALLASLRNRPFARSCARQALNIALQLKRPNLAYRANELLGLL